MIGYDEIVSLVAELEHTTFSDGWSRDSIEDTLKYNYNCIYTTWNFREKTYIIKCQSDSVDGTKHTLGYYTEDGIPWEEGYNNSQDIEFTGYLIANNIADESELLRIAVKKDFRCYGIGGKLIRFYHNDIGDSGKTFFLEVRESNQAARHLYEKNSYTKIATRKNYYKSPDEDGVIYQYLP